MNAVYVYDALRTPRGKGRPNGGLHAQAPVELLKSLWNALAARYGLAPDAVDDMILGCVTQVGDQGGNIAKVAALYAGLASSVGGVTLNRYCASGLDACNFGAMKIMTGQDQLVLGGGVESMSRVEMLSDRASFYCDPAMIRAARFVPMGLAADLIASLDGTSREECDAYAVRSQRRAAEARSEGRFNRSIVPIANGDGVLAEDEIIRPDVNVAMLAGFEPMFGELAVHYLPAFREAFPTLGELKAVHHKGNSPGMVDGASLVLLGSAAAGAKCGLKPRARIVAMANASGSELLALTGGIEASRGVLQRAGMSFGDLDLVEFNEAFASTSLKFIRDCGLDPDRVNVNGGAISLGHPMGATGGMLIGMALDELERRDGNVAMISVSGAAGLGTATVIERV